MVFLFCIKTISYKFINKSPNGTYDLFGKNSDIVNNINLIKVF